MHSHNLSQWEHDHTFAQDERRPGESRTLIVIAITATMMVVEIFAGIHYGSMALLADGLHMASHTVALGITAFAYYYARRHARDRNFSFGTGKVNSLGGFTGAILLAVFAFYMAIESLERLVDPVEIAFNQAIVVAVLGLVVNGVSVFILGADGHNHGHDHHLDHGHSHDHHHSHSGHSHHHHEHDHNLKSAYLHVMAGRPDLSFGDRCAPVCQVLWLGLDGPHYGSGRCCTRSQMVLWTDGNHRCRVTRSSGP